jgi:hypothetical protein
MSSLEGKMTLWSASTVPQATSTQMSTISKRNGFSYFCIMWISDYAIFYPTLTTNVVQDYSLKFS